MCIISHVLTHFFVVLSWIFQSLLVERAVCSKTVLSWKLEREKMIFHDQKLWETLKTGLALLKDFFGVTHPHINSTILQFVPPLLWVSTTVIYLSC